MTTLQKRTIKLKKYLGSVLVLASFLSVLPAHALTQEEDYQMRVFINKGNQLLSRRLYDQAIEEYEKALALDPGNRIALDNIALVHNNRGNEYFSRRNFAEAKKEWEKALEINPRDGVARRNLQVLALHMSRMNARPKPNSDLNPNPDSSEDLDDDDIPTGEVPNQKKAETSDRPERQDDLKDKEKSNSPSKEEKPQTNNQAPSAVIINAGEASTADSTEAESSQSVESILSDSLATLKSVSHKNTAPSPVVETDPFKVVKEPEESNSSEERETKPKPKEPAAKSDIANAKKGREESAGKNTEKNSKEITSPRKSSRNKKRQKADSKSRNDKDDELNLKEKLARLEKEVFGEVRERDPIMKRLKQLEKDTLGKQQSGTVKERIKNLNELYGF